MVIVLCINREPFFSLNNKKIEFYCFSTKIIHHILFTNADFEQNEKKRPSSFVPVSLFRKLNCDGGTGRRHLKTLFFSTVMSKDSTIKRGLPTIFSPLRRDDDLNNYFISYRKVLRKDNA